MKTVKGMTAVQYADKVVDTCIEVIENDAAYARLTRANLNVRGAELALSVVTEEMSKSDEKEFYTAVIEEVKEIIQFEMKKR